MNNGKEREDIVAFLRRQIEKDADRLAPVIKLNEDEVAENEGTVKVASIQLAY